MALGIRQVPFADMAGIGPGRGRVLRVTLRKAGNRGCPEAQQNLGPVIGVALEVAPQLTRPGGHRKPVAGTGKMVDADFGIAVGHEQVARGVEQGQPVFVAGQRLFGDHHLALGHPGDMGITIQRHPVGRQRQQLLDGFRNAAAVLMRQAIQDVGVQAGNVVAADQVDRLAGQFERLHPTDGFLDLGVEILHPDGRAVHSGRCKRGHARGVDFGRVDLDREFAPFGHRHHVEDRIRHAAHLVGRQQRGRAPAPMQPRQPHPARQVPAQQLQFRQNRVHIGDDRIQRLGALRAAGAEPAQPAAERHMQVQRNRRPLGDGIQPPGDHFGGHAGLELCRWGIARVTRDTRIEQAQPLELRNIAHAVRIRRQRARMP